MNNTPNAPKTSKSTSRTLKNKTIVSDKRKKSPSPPKSDIQKLKLLVTIVDRTKADFYMDLLLEPELSNEFMKKIADVTIRVLKEHKKIIHPST